MKTLKTILIGLSGLSLIYLLFAFIMWDLNPSNWDGIIRFACLLLGFIISSFMVIIFPIKKDY